MLVQLLKTEPSLVQDPAAELKIDAENCLILSGSYLQLPSHPSHLSTEIGWEPGRPHAAAQTPEQSSSQIQELDRAPQSSDLAPGLLLEKKTSDRHSDQVDLDTYGAAIRERRKRAAISQEILSPRGERKFEKISVWGVGFRV